MLDVYFCSISELVSGGLIAVLVVFMTEEWFVQTPAKPYVGAFVSSGLHVKGQTNLGFDCGCFRLWRFCWSSKETMAELAGWTDVFETQPGDAMVSWKHLGWPPWGSDSSKTNSNDPKDNYTSANTSHQRTYQSHPKNVLPTYHSFPSRTKYQHQHFLTASTAEVSPPKHPGWASTVSALEACAIGNAPGDQTPWIMISQRPGWRVERGQKTRGNTMCVAFTCLSR